MDSQINYTTVWQTQRTYVPQLASHTTNTTSIPLPPIWSVVLLALLALNCKNLPLAWHYRITNAFSYVLRSQRTVRKDGELNVFDAVITESLSPLTVSSCYVTRGELKPNGMIGDRLQSTQIKQYLLFRRRYRSNKPHMYSFQPRH